LNVKTPSSVKLVVYNILGQQIKVIEDSELLKGKKVYYWNALNSYNQTVSSGIYFIRAIVKENDSGKIYSKMKKMILLK
jgi:flagellar hook assembly protein FlgD